MDTHAVILATILRVAEPGVSDYSRVELPTCQAESCAEWSERWTGRPAAYDFKGVNETTWHGWSRPETRLEGMERFAEAAAAFHRVVMEPPESWDPRWSDRAMINAGVTIMRHESALWRDVATGLIRGLAGEVCYMQIHPKNLLRFGLAESDVLGLDIDSVETCIRTGIDILARATEGCDVAPDKVLMGERWDGGLAWFSGAIVTYGVGSGCHLDEAWVRSRKRMYARLVKTGGAPLDADAHLALLSVGPGDWWGSAGPMYVMSEAERDWIGWK